MCALIFCALEDGSISKSCTDIWKNDPIIYVQDMLAGIYKDTPRFPQMGQWVCRNLFKKIDSF